MFTNQIKVILISGLFAYVLGGCAKPEQDQTIPNKPLSRLDRLISRPGCKVVISGDEGENLSMSKLTCVKESAKLSIELDADSKVVIDEVYVTMFAPFIPMTARTSHQSFTAIYLKNPYDFVILNANGTAWALLSPSEDLKKANLTFLDDSFKRVSGKNTLELSVQSCGQ